MQLSPHGPTHRVKIPDLQCACSCSSILILACPLPRPRALIEPASTTHAFTHSHTHTHQQPAETLRTASTALSRISSTIIRLTLADAAHCDLDGHLLLLPQRRVGFCSPFRPILAPSDMPRPNFGSPPPSSLKASRVVPNPRLGLCV